jgi:hypothetical protein
MFVKTPKGTGFLIETAYEWSDKTGDCDRTYQRIQLLDKIYEYDVDTSELQPCRGIMNLDWIRMGLAAIEAARDFEQAHILEDELHRDVLRAIADGRCERARDCTDLALSSLKIKYSRRYG